MDKAREAFEAWFSGFECDKDFPLMVWQAAWEARGKHDAEICRKVKTPLLDVTCEQCAQAIEEAT